MMRTQDAQHSDAEVTHSPVSGDDQAPTALVGAPLTLAAFQNLAGHMAGYGFVKIVVERQSGRIHFINNNSYRFHADYVAEQILGESRDELRARIDEFNRSVYLSHERPYILGLLSLHENSAGPFFALETVEIDNMGGELLQLFYGTVRDNVDASVPLFFKPANHWQESVVANLDHNELPRVFSHELFSSQDFVALNEGEAEGRLRLFTEEGYNKNRQSIRWYDIIVMDKVPDDIPRVSGIINASHTTPLSHTNVLACGWQIPNAVQLGIKDRIKKEKLDGQWVRCKVDTRADHVALEKIPKPKGRLQRPAWTVHQIRLEEPETEHTPITPLDKLRMSDRFRYGTKAANIGELRHVLDKGSGRLTGFYRIPRPPRSNLLGYLADYLQVPDDADLTEYAWDFLRHTVAIPRGIAIPFSIQQEFLAASPRIQQAIGKLKMALELEAKEVDAICLMLQRLIKETRMSDKLRDTIDAQIATHLGGISSFVVRSSSNAEDLKDFSAAGIYESINHVTTADNIFESIKDVWASLVSPRSVRLRHEVGISLDDSYMGVIIQEEVPSELGGVMVTTNPMNPRGDFRNVFVNASARSAVEVVEGQTLPYQYLFNTVEGGGRTLSIGQAERDLPQEQKQTIQKLAVAGRLLQSHFSQDYTFSTPVDIEWAAYDGKVNILQLRPYAV